MNPLDLFLFLIIFFISDVEAQNNQLATPSNSDDIATAFRPSMAVVIGVLSIFFSLTCILLMYAKFCHTTTSDLFNRGVDPHHQLGLLQPRSRFSGIDKTVIESLPFFTFSSLKGSKEGLECSVCLSKFEDTEILRLLPKCKHAFHINCVDQWLESHSSCPLCRCKVNANDPTIFTYSNSLRFSNVDPSDLREDPDLELFVHREPDNEGSSRFSIGGSFRKAYKGKKDELLVAERSEDQRLLHKFKHRIIVSDVVFKNRWSDVNSSDLMFLNSEMLNVSSSKRFSCLDSNSERFSTRKTGFDGNGSSSSDRIMTLKEEMEKKRSLESKASKMRRSLSVSVPGFPSTSDSDANSRAEFLIPPGKRSMSEITNFSRFADFGGKNRIKESSMAGNNGKEEKMRKLWLPIARRTVMWLAGRERRSQSHHARQASNV
ncbi:E3 ubiquitin-protein ligase ATL42-like [Magnolia sinica]|uniref:E3 ubiquitin-protein ligase ATL42-like n=1 Tax=Magnolia sinica TaxID=86752 RepID=UPI0026590E6C|nr:E3 ubiquitin-protein ligase ATL42-like [Magnolia sinica]